MNDAVRIVAEIVERNTLLELENKMLKEKLVDSERFHSVPMSLEVAGQLHGVSSKVIRRLVELGLIPKHPQSSDSKILLRTSEVLRLSIEELKEKAKHLRHV